MTHFVPHSDSRVISVTRLSYVKAIDVWMSTNLVFVFVAYMEYAVVTVMSRRSRSHAQVPVVLFD